MLLAKCKVSKTFYFCYPRSNDSEEREKCMEKKLSLMSASNSHQPISRLSSKICCNPEPLATEWDVFLQGTQAPPRPGSHYIIFPSSISLPRLMGKK